MPARALSCSVKPRATDCVFCRRLASFPLPACADLYLGRLGGLYLAVKMGPYLGRVGIPAAPDRTRHALSLEGDTTSAGGDTIRAPSAAPQC